MTTYYYILDVAGRAVVEPDEHRWYEWMTERAESPELRVGYTVVAGTVQVTTTFVGFSMEPDATQLWQTMITGGAMDGVRYRYPDRATALRGHERAVQVVRETEAGRRANGSGPRR